MYIKFITIHDVKEKVLELKGKPINMEINKGRNRIVELRGVIDKVYPSMFIIKPEPKSGIDRYSYSYSDVLCGDIKLDSN